MNLEHMTVDEIISSELDVPAEHFGRIISDVRSESLETIDYLSEKVDRLEHTLMLQAPILRSVKEFMSEDQLETLRMCGVNI